MAYERIPNGQAYIDPLKNENLFGNVSFGLGPGGKLARKAIGQFGSGQDISNNDFFKYKLGQAKAAQAQQDTERNRNIRANLAYSGQPGLTAGIEAEKQNQADQNFQNNIMGAAGDSFQQAMDEYFRSRGAKNNVALQAAGIREKQLADTASLYNGQFQQKKPGLGSQILGGVLGFK